MVTVGKLKPKEVSDINHKLFKQAEKMIEASTEDLMTCFHMGFKELGDFIDWLTENYDITERK